MTAGDWRIPPSVLHWLDTIPATAPTALLLRHSVRNPLPPDDVGFAVPLTPAGIALARQLGERLGDRIRTVHTSPVPRCVQTARALLEGANVEPTVVADRLLGDPGVYVVDGRRAWSNWLELGHERVMHHLATANHPLPGMADPGPAARFLVHHMLATTGGRGGIHVFVSHDSLVATTASRLLGRAIGPADWPWFLEAAFFWREGADVVAAYRNWSRSTPADTLTRLDERHAIDFARRAVGHALGRIPPARFFVAGGAFKTLLTGRPPRDLDLWAPSIEDREALLAALHERGTPVAPPPPFSDAFAIGACTVELSHAVAPSTLEERLDRFDIALSAVGAEHDPERGWRAVVHPLALESVRRRELLLLQPLRNWKYALATLARLRRYADQTGYAIPAGAERVLWRTFDMQDDAMKRGMIERFTRTVKGHADILDEAVRRLRAPERHAPPAD